MWLPLVLSLSVSAKPMPKVALMPLQSGIGASAGLGQAWAPLLAQLVYEHGYQPIYPPAEKLDAETRARIRDCRNATCYQEIGAAFGAKKLIAGGITRELGRFTVTMTLYDLSKFNEESRTERHFYGTKALDIELAAMLDALFNPQPEPVAVVLPLASSAPPLASVTLEETRTVYRYRPAAWTFTAIGIAGLVGGGALLTTSFVLKPGFETAATAYNTAPQRPTTQYNQLIETKRTLDAVYTSSFIALGVGAAALVTGIVLFAVDGKKEPRVVVAPMGPGAIASVQF